MNIRLLGPDDAQQYRVIRLEALKNSPEAFAASYEEEKSRTVEQYKDKLFSNDLYTYGAFDHEKLIGVVTVVRETRIKLSHRANIVAMYVIPEKRSRGVGWALLENAINIAKETNQIEQINISVVTTNESAKKLYSKLGFSVFGTEKKALKLEHIYFDEDHMVLYL